MRCRKVSHAYEVLTCIVRNLIVFSYGVEMGSVGVEGLGRRWSHVVVISAGQVAYGPWAGDHQRKI
jgi:hypothetical protein